MSKVKVKTLIGSTVAVLSSLTAIVAFLLYAFPEKMASAAGFGPYNGQKILTLCAVMVTVLFMVGWLIEKAFDFSGKAGLYFHWGENRKRLATPVSKHIAGREEEDEAVFNEERVIEHLQLRYGRHWKNKIRLLLVLGNKDETQKAAPGLCRDLWQEGDGNVLIYGGDAQSQPDEALLSSLKRLRSANPIDGIVQVINTSALPTERECDAFLRYRQKADRLLGRQAPIWLWLIDKAGGAQPGRDIRAAGALFGPGATPQDAGMTLDALVPPLRTVGMAQVFADPNHD